MLKTLFPACAHFGPLFIAIGSLFPYRGDSFPFSFIMATAGALLTSTALVLLFRAVNALEKPPAAQSTRS